MSRQKHCAGSKVKTLHDELRAASKPQNRAASPPSWRDQPMGFSVGDRLVGVSTRATGRSSTAPARASVTVSSVTGFISAVGAAPFVATNE